MMKLRIHGAAGTVTGSMYELYSDSGEFRALIDCGAFQDEGEQESKAFPFDPETVKYVLLTHAHLDHCGRLPELAREGFAGHIVCTHETLRLTRASLENSVHLSDDFSDEDVHLLFINADAALAGRPQHTSGPRWLVKWTPYSKTMPLYQFEDERYPTIFFRMLRSSHLLGAVGYQLNWFNDDGRDRRDIVFYGDSGPEPTYSAEKTGLLCAKNFRYAPPPAWALNTELTVVVESTYGANNSTSLSRSERLESLEELLLRVVAEQKKLLIPTFSIGRTQNVLFDIAVLRRRNPQLRGLSVLSPPDGTLADEASHIYADELLISQFSDGGRHGPKVKPTYANRSIWEDLGFDIHTREEAEEGTRMFRSALGLEQSPTYPIVKKLGRRATIEDIPKGSVTVVSSGMGVGGASGRLLPTFATSPEAIICSVGFAAAKTPVAQLMRFAELTREQRQLLPHESITFADNKTLSLASTQAELLKLQGYSGHATKDAITDLTLPLDDGSGKGQPEWPTRVLLVHGSTHARRCQRDALKSRVEDYGKTEDVQLLLPDVGDTFNLDENIELQRRPAE